MFMYTDYNQHLLDNVKKIHFIGCGGSGMYPLIQILASKGYPGKYEKGAVIEGVELVDGKVFHMGTALKDGNLVTAGGRVMMVVCEGRSIAEAAGKVYAQIAEIRCDNLFYRKDIAHWALENGGGRIIDGKLISERVKTSVKTRVEVFEKRFGRKPSLTVIIVGCNPASQVYVRNKVKTAAYVGMESRQIELPETVSEAELLKVIDNLNHDDTVDGILVQLPVISGGWMKSSEQKIMPVSRQKLKNLVKIMYTSCHI